MPKYYAWTFIAPVVIVVTICVIGLPKQDYYPSEIIDMMVFTKEGGLDYSKQYSYTRMYYNLMVCLIFVFFVLIAQFSVIYTFKRLWRKGVTPVARKAFVINHILYVFVFLITWTVLLINNYKALYNFTSRKESTFADPNMQDYISYILLAGNGILLTLVRL